MDLRRIEDAINKLEPEVENIAAVGRLRHELATLSKALDIAVKKMGRTGERAATGLTEVNETVVHVKAQILEVQTSLTQLARDIDERVGIKLAAATSSFEQLVRAELRTMSERFELRQNAALTKITESEAAIQTGASEVFQELRAAQKNTFRLVVVAVVLAAIGVFVSLR